MTRGPASTATIAAPTRHADKFASPSLEASDTHREESAARPTPPGRARAEAELARPGLRVSVVIPCYRCAGTIDRALDSVFGQSLPPAEVILVDDGSDDRTLERLHDARARSPGIPVTVVALPANGGPASARNAGWDRAGGQLVAFLDADESWHPMKLREQVSFMEGRPDVQLSSHRAVRLREGASGLDDTGHPPARATERDATRVTLWRLLYRNEFRTCTVIVRRELGFRFPAGQYYCEDFRLWLQMLSKGVTACRLDDVLAYTYKPPFGDSGLSANLVGMERERVRSILAVHREGGLTHVQLGVALCLSSIKFARKVLLANARRLRAPRARHRRSVRVPPLSGDDAPAPPARNRRR